MRRFLSAGLKTQRVDPAEPHLFSARFFFRLIAEQARRLRSHMTAKPAAREEHRHSSSEIRKRILISPVPRWGSTHVGRYQTMTRYCSKQSRRFKEEPVMSCVGINYSLRYTQARIYYNASFPCRPSRRAKEASTNTAPPPSPRPRVHVTREIIRSCHSALAFASAYGISGRKVTYDRVHTSQNQ